MTDLDRDEFADSMKDLVGALVEAQVFEKEPLRVDLMQAELANAGRQFANPPEGWFAFGHHTGKHYVEGLEFWGTGTDGLPIWERPKRND